MKHDSALVAARTLAGMGYACFPCLPDKRPATPNGFKAATTDRDGIEELWARHPGELVGVATGTASLVDVIDVDAKHSEAWSWLAAHRRRLLPARIHGTRSGGVHLLFLHHPGLTCSASRIARGVDVRADGGYAIWWPAAGMAVLSDAGLRPLPEWLAAELMPPPRPIARRAIEARDLRPTLHRAVGIIGAVLAAKEGERNRILFWSACRARDMVVGDEIDHTAGVDVLEALRRAGAEVGLSPREIDRTISSAMRGSA